MGYSSPATDHQVSTDENKDGALTTAEWKGMLIDPKPADGNGDGRITVEEYAGWLQNRQN